MKWSSAMQLQARRYKCGFCSATVAPDRGWVTDDILERRVTGDVPDGAIYVCPNCAKPTFFNNRPSLSQAQVPGPLPGRRVRHVPSDLDGLHDEACLCVADGAHTASVMACRKMLMNIAVNKGAKEGQHFVEYVDFLFDNGYVPPDGRKWVDRVRHLGNEANHEIRPMAERDARLALKFVENLLRFVYELPGDLGEEKADSEAD